MEQTVVARFAALFKGRDTGHGRYIEEPRKVWTAKGPATPELFAEHLAGTGPYLGTTPILEDNTCLWAALDVDDDGTDHRALAAAVEALQLPMVTCRSKSGGAHLYLFLTEPVPAKIVRDKLKTFLAALNLTHNHDGRPVEIFPKQSRMRASEGGNWINLPYYGGDATNRYAVLPTGEHLTLAQFLDKAEALKLSRRDFEATRAAGADPFDEGPPCLKVLHQLGYPSGTRNQGLYNVGVYMKNAHPDDWADRVRAYNDDRMDPPLKGSELQGLLQSLERREYNYKCGELPLQPHCQRGECKKQKFGIGAQQRAKDLSLLPELGRLAKVETDPPRWLLPIGGATVDLTTEDLLSLQRLRRVVLEKAMVLLPMIKQSEWDDRVRELIADAEIITAPEDAGVLGQFKALVAEFLARRVHAETRDDLITGLPLEEEGKVMFRSQDLLGWLVKKGFKAYEPSQVFTILRDHFKADATQARVKGAQLRLWRVPTPDGELSEPLATVTTAKRGQPSF